LKNYLIIKNISVLALLTVLGILIAGYHPGAEDDEVYLAAIKHNLNPSLFPHDADFFKVQLQATIFDKVVAASVLWTHLSVGTVVFAWHFLAIFLVLLGCWRISCRCFRETYAQWASVTMVAVLFTLPAAGSALYLVDQNLHPRALATAAILAAIVETLDRRYVLAGVLLVLAALMHPIMASFGISFCIFLVWRQPPELTAFALALAPLGWIFEPTSDAWRAAANTRDYYFLGRWQWYEWLGVFAPVAFLWWFRRIGQRKGATALGYLSTRLIAFSIFQLAVALIVMLPPTLERLRPFQPMRYLHLFYLLFVVLGGGLLGQDVLGKHWWRWLVLFAPLAGGMFYAQRQTYPATSHLELPGTPPSNPWLQAFSWIRVNTSTESYFALGPDFMRLPGEDYHGFRALAERSSLADTVKDSAVATQVPRLATRWQQEVEAQEGWRHFTGTDFQRLKSRFGVDWVVLQQPGVAGLACPYQNSAVLVCRVD
jgi:hypothetical protein